MQLPTRLLISVRNLVLLGLCIGLVPVATAQTSHWMPNGDKAYWSFLGSFSNDEVETALLLRQQVDSTVFVNGRRTERVNQKVIPALGGESLTEIDRLNPKIYQNTNNGWHVYREELGSRVLEYQKAARILPDRFELGQSYKYKVRLKGDSGVFGVVSYHAVPIGFEEVTLRNGIFDSLKVNIEKRVKLASDERGEQLIEESTEHSSNWFVRDVGLVKQHVAFTGVDSDDSTALNYDVELIASSALPNYLWPQSRTNQDGWKLVEWLGYLTDNHFPWIFHSDHGWLYVDAEDTSDVRLWSESLGWWYTSADLYPLFYSHEMGEWLSFEGGVRNERSFKREDGSIVKVTAAGFLPRAQKRTPPIIAVGDDATKADSLEFRDAEGNLFKQDGSNGLQLVVNNPPTVKILHPFEGNIVQDGERLLILADAKDEDGTIFFVKFLANGKLIGIVQKPPYQVVLTADASIETYSVVAIAQDDSGNETTSDAVIVEVKKKEMVPPRVRVASPLNKSVFVYGKKIWIDVVASDVDGFVETVHLLVDDIQVGDEQTTPPYRFSFVPPVSGTYQISAVAVDDDLNETESKVISVTVEQEETTTVGEIGAPGL